MCDKILTYTAGSEYEKFLSLRSSIFPQAVPSWIFRWPSWNKFFIFRSSCVVSIYDYYYYYYYYHTSNWDANTYFVCTNSHHFPEFNNSWCHDTVFLPRNMSYMTSRHHIPRNMEIKVIQTRNLLLSDT